MPMNDYYQEAKGWLELCQESIRLGLSANEIPFDKLIGALDKYLPCEIQVGDNPPISVTKIGSVHPQSHSLSYRGARHSELDNQVMGGGISLANAKIIEKPAPPQWEDPLY
jgi:hypothetical protein